MAAAARMAEGLLVVVLLMAAVLMADCTTCGTGSIKCASSAACVSYASVCNGRGDCPDGEDEETAFCEIYKGSTSRCSTAGETLCGQSYNCYTFQRACSKHCSPYAPPTELCTVVTAGVLPAKKREPDQDIAPQLDIKEVASFMSVANCSLENTSVLTNASTTCPLLYTSMGDACIAPLPFALTWPEARVACQSIAGKLFEVDVFETFAEVVQYLIKADFSGNYWIGGFYDIETEDWVWSSGPKMPRSTPYWAMQHNSMCTTRESTSLGALPGCFHYEQAPTSNGTGYCAALQFKYMYYISDERCFQKKQPLCIHE